ncbi:Lipocalin [Varanus komodoensis]|nr:Lipocalin [Varanus komodoensis]
MVQHRLGLGCSLVPGEEGRDEDEHRGGGPHRRRESGGHLHLPQDQCETRKSSFLRTEQPGLFSYTSPRSGSVHTVQVLDINRHEYALLLAKTAKGAGTSTMVTLYGRSRQLRPELQEKFRQAALAEGLAPEDVLILPQTGTWHVVAAVSNCSTFQSMRGVMKTSVAKVTALPDGDMSILTGFPV